jgi:phosphotriesterase-related protein
MRRDSVLAILLAVAGWGAAPSSAQDLTGKIQTVLGLVDPRAVGITLTHEHLFIDFTLPLDEPQRWLLAERHLPRSEAELAIWNMPVSMDKLSFLHAHVWENRDLLLMQDMNTTLAEVEAFSRAGGSAIVDVTSTGLGRDPRKLEELARKSGLHIVMGSGWYRHAWHPAGHQARSVESLAAEIVRDITEGVDGTGIRAGIIGEVAAMEIVTHPQDSAEVKGLRAAARASRATGAAISLHQWMGDGTALTRTLDILQSEGADLSRVIVGHVDGVVSNDVPRLTSVLQRGVTLQFDLFGTPYTLSNPRLDTRPMADAIVALAKAGYGGRMLMSHDVCTKIQQHAYGGKGLDFVQLQVVPYLREHGVSDADIRRITVENPRRLLAFAAPRPAP